MKKFHKILAIGLGVAAVAAISIEVTAWATSRDPVKLQPYTSEEGRFTAQLPPGVEVEVDTLKTAVGELPVHMLRTRTKFVQYMLVYTDYPDDYMAKGGPGEILKAAAKGAADNIGGKLVRQKAFIEKGQAVREVRVRGRKGMQMRSHLTLVGNRMYQVMAITSLRHINDKTISTVLSSFEPKPAPPAPPPAAVADTLADTAAADSAK
jgi:hypothetical protein